MHKTNAIDQLVFLFSKLPGLGPRSARRIVLHLLQDKDTRLQGFIDGMSTALNHIELCKICGNIDSSDLCQICTSHNRSDSIIAIVETVAELWAIERSGHFKGKYHVLGFSASSHKQKSADEMKLGKLLDRCKAHNVEEIIIATNSTLEGQTVGYFITEYLKNLDIKISRLASGIPMGGELDYLDDGTLSAALDLRRPFS